MWIICLLIFHFLPISFWKSMLNRPVVDEVEDEILQTNRVIFTQNKQDLMSESSDLLVLSRSSLPPLQTNWRASTSNIEIKDLFMRWESIQIWRLFSVFPNSQTSQSSHMLWQSHNRIKVWGFVAFQQVVEPSDRSNEANNVQCCRLEPTRLTGCPIW